MWCDIDIIVRAVEATGRNIGEFVSVEYFDYSEHCVYAGSILCLCDIEIHSLKDFILPGY